MRYQIDHATIYSYDDEVMLEPHVIRLCPRSDGSQSLLSFSVEIDPVPSGMSSVLDLENNSVIQVWFNQPTRVLRIRVGSEVETKCSNPFNYILEPIALQLPIDYPSSTLIRLFPYLEGANRVDPGVFQLAQDILEAVEGVGDRFLIELNNQIYQSCTQVVRPTGKPFLPGITWKQKSGSCRDLALLFMEVCRVVGLGSRFVSGYQEGDPDQENRYLHAWVEVYLPGAGWRGYDPTQGLVVSDRHVVLAASANYVYAAPIVGGYRPAGVRSSMEYSLLIEPR